MINRREALYTLASVSTFAWSGKAPAMISPEAQRPLTLWGAMVGEVSHHSAIFWSRTDRLSQLHLRWSLDPDFKKSYQVISAKALPQFDYTVRVPLLQLPAGCRIFYWAYFESTINHGVRSLPIMGEFNTASKDVMTPVRFAWSGDSFGQGYGINPQFGGVKIYDAIRKNSPDVFIHCGDRIYADQPLKPLRGGGKGRRWYNLLTPAVQKVAQTLDDFRGYYRYTMLDTPTKHLARTCGQIFLWDDHEVKNDWWPGRMLRDRRYQIRDCNVLANHSRQAFFEYTPLPPQWIHHQKIYRRIPFGPLLDFFALDSRSFRGPNTKIFHALPTYEKNAHYFGPQQLQWIKDSLKQSSALWKVMISPQPLGLLIGSGSEDVDGIASGIKEAKGRELELKELLSFIRREKITNVVWVSADVHYAAAHHFHPDFAYEKDFIPFWEFVAGPLNAATLGPRRLDTSFGARCIFKSVPDKMRGSKSPLDELQFYGLGEVDPISQQLKISLHDLNGKELFNKRLIPSI